MAACIAPEDYENDLDLRRTISQRSRVSLYSLYPNQVSTTSCHMSSIHNVASQASFEQENENIIWVDFDGPDDAQNPRNFTFLSKVLILFIISLQCLLTVLYSTSFQTGAKAIGKEFNILNPYRETLGITMYLIGLAFGPILWAPLSELYGRRHVFLISGLLFVVFFIPVGVAHNFSTILAARFISGFAGSAAVSNGGGVLADIFSEENRGFAISLYFLCPLMGPVIGPIYGGFTFDALGWRWLTWFVAIAALVLYILTIFFLKETYAPFILDRKALRLQKDNKALVTTIQIQDDTAKPFSTTDYEKDIESPSDAVRPSSSSIRNPIFKSIYMKDEPENTKIKIFLIFMYRPIQFFFTEWICIAFDIWVAVVYGILYLSFTSYPIIFGEHRGWNPGLQGLSFIGIGIGIGLCIGLYQVFTKWYRKQPINPKTGRRSPEARLLPCMVGAIASPIGLFWFAWTSPKNVPWIVPLSATIPFGFGNTCIFIYSSAYIIDAYSIYSASALAANTVARSLLGAVFPLAGIAMFHNLSIQYAGTILACVSTAVAIVPFLFYIYGHRIRASSRYCSLL